MGGASTARASALGSPALTGGGRGRRWLAALPFALSWSLAAGMLNAALAPAPPADQLRLEQAPSPPAADPPASHDDPSHDDLYDALDLISV
jgi:hypothetical protein